MNIVTMNSERITEAQRRKLSELVNNDEELQCASRSLQWPKEQVLAARWEHFAIQLNAIPGPKKTAVEWRTYNNLIMNISEQNTVNETVIGKFNSPHRIKEDRYRLPDLQPISRPSCSGHPISQVSRKRTRSIGNDSGECRKGIGVESRGVFYEKKTEVEVLNALSQEKVNCKELWLTMGLSAKNKLKHLLKVDDHIDKFIEGDLMTITDWLLFDTVLVHQDFDVIDMPETTKEDKKIHVELFELVSKFQIEHLTGDQLADAWSAVTMNYNNENRRCTPMLLQRRWYQLKLAARTRFLKFGSLYNRQSDSSVIEQYRPTPLQINIVKKFKTLLTKPFMLWEDLIKNELVILREQFERIAVHKRTIPNGIQPSSSVIPIVSSDVSSNPERHIKNTIPNPNELESLTSNELESQTLHAPYKKQDDESNFTNLTAFQLEANQLVDDSYDEIEIKDEVLQIDNDEQTHSVDKQNNNLLSSGDVINASVDIKQEDVEHNSLYGNSHSERHIKNTLPYPNELGSPTSNELESQTIGITIATPYKEEDDESSFTNLTASELDENQLVEDTRSYDEIEFKDEVFQIDIDEQTHSVDKQNSNLLSLGDVINANAVMKQEDIEDNSIPIITEPVISNIQCNNKNVLRENHMAHVQSQTAKNSETVFPKITNIFGNVLVSNETLSKICQTTDQISKNPNETFDIEETESETVDNIPIQLRSGSNKEIKIEIIDDGSENSVEIKEPLMDCNYESSIHSEQNNSVSEVSQSMYPQSKGLRHQIGAQVENKIDTETCKVTRVKKKKEEEPTVDQKLLMIPVVLAVRLEDLSIMPINFFKHVHGKRLIDVISSCSKPVIKKNNIKTCSAISTNNVKRVKLSSELLQKPRILTYNAEQLSQNPDFNINLKCLNADFFKVFRNKLLLNSCKPLTVDVSKAFEKILIHGILYLSTSGYNEVHETGDNTKNNQNNSVRHSDLSAHSFKENTKNHISSYRRITPKLVEVKSLASENPEMNECKKVKKEPDIGFDAQNSKLFQILTSKRKQVIHWPPVSYNNNDNNTQCNNQLSLIALNGILFVLDKSNNKLCNEENKRKSSAIEGDKNNIHESNKKHKTKYKRYFSKETTVLKPLETFCCWARERIDQLETRKRPTKHKCLYPSCQCCCKAALTEFYLNYGNNTLHFKPSDDVQPNVINNTSNIESNLAKNRNDVTSVVLDQAIPSNVDQGDLKSQSTTIDKAGQLSDNIIVCDSESNSSIKVVSHNDILIKSENSSCEEADWRIDPEKSSTLVNTFPRLEQHQRNSSPDPVKDDKAETLKNLSSNLSRSYLFLRIHNILMTSLRVPPNLNEFITFRCSVKEKLDLPKGLQLKLLPSGRVTLKKRVGVKVSRSLLVDLASLVDEFHHEHSKITMQSSASDISKTNSTHAPPIKPENSSLIQQSFLEDQSPQYIYQSTPPLHLVTMNNYKNNVIIQKLQSNLGNFLNKVLNPIKSISELQYVYSRNGLFFKFDLNTGSVLPINIQLKSIHKTVEAPTTVEIEETELNAPKALENTEHLTKLVDEEVNTPVINIEPILKFQAYEDMIKIRESSLNINSSPSNGDETKLNSERICKIQMMQDLKIKLEESEPKIDGSELERRKRQSTNGSFDEQTLAKKLKYIK